eukprot:PhF_6_TR13186/c1_g1_i1/m.20808
MVSSFWCLPFGCSSVCGGISHRKMVLLLLIMEIAATLCDSSALKNNCIVYSLSQGSFVENEDADEEEKKQNNKIPTMYLKEDLRKIPDTIVNNNNGGLCRVLIPYGNILVLSDDMLIPYPLLGAWIQKHTLPLLGLFLLGLNLHVLGFASIIFDAIPYYNAYHYVGGILIIVVLLLLSAPLRRSYLLHLIGYVDFWLITLYACVSFSVYLSIQQRYRGNEFDAYLYLPLALNGALMGSFFVGLDSSTYSLRFRKWGMIGLIVCMSFCALATFFVCVASRMSSAYPRNFFRTRGYVSVSQRHAKHSLARGVLLRFRS